MDDRQKVTRLMEEGNFRDAFDLLQKVLVNPRETDENLGTDFGRMAVCLQSLQRINELDLIAENLLVRHPEKWRLHREIAAWLISGQHYGFTTAGEFSRGDARGSGQWSDSTERDRVRALQILLAIRKFADADGKGKELADFYYLISSGINLGREHGNAWRFQVLTDIATLPDIDVNEEGHWGRGHFGMGHWGGDSAKGAPVDADGNPIFYGIATEWDAAKNDGERCRWAREKAATIDPVNYRDLVDLEFARFQLGQFGVQTMASYGAFFRDRSDNDKKPQADNPYAVSTLTDDETICRLATGIKRIKLPPEFNHVRLFQSLADRSSDGTAFQALSALGSIFENRQQYGRAAEAFKLALKKNPAEPSLQQRIDQIEKPWGMFENAEPRVAGKGASVEFRFRNGKKVSFKAYNVNIEKLLTDIKAHLKSNPENLDWNKVQLDSIGYSILSDEMAQYVDKDPVASWDLALEPRPNHFDRRITVTTPLQKGGAYLVNAQMENSNPCSILLWVADTSIVKKQIDAGHLYMIADSETGKPVSDCNVEFFGWKQEWKQNAQRAVIETTNFAEASDKDGFVIPENRQLKDGFQWLTIARNKEGRLAFLGMSHIWRGRVNHAWPRETKGYGITDRPIYRPDQTVKYKFWLRETTYESDQKQRFANEKVRFLLYDPQGKELVNEVRSLGEDGGLDGEYKLPADATLGSYRVQIMDPDQRDYNLIAFNFRVEEYKKPEFEVTVKAPEKPTMLGEKVPVKIAANYFFGGPVSQGVVKYKVHRTKKNQRWFPVGRWDWLYGNGYLWLGSEYDWYPGFGKWGCLCPTPPWWGDSADPPELVLDEEGKLNADGFVEFNIDTAIAKVAHGDDDHEYSITAEVVDASRRTIVGSGKVIVAYRPFSVHVWCDRGYARVGDPIEVAAQVQTADGKGVAGKGKLILNRVVYDANGKPTETELQTWDVQSDEEGSVRQQIKATEAGQYRLAVLITDEKGQTVEGGQLLHVVGDQFDSANFRYNDLEVLVEKSEYKPGEKVKLLINSNRTGARLMVWVRPQNVYAGRPEIIQLDGKSTTYEVDVLQSDMPNFFVEVMTIFGAKIHTVSKEIVVPPVKKVVNVALLPKDKKVLPGAETEISVKLTDAEGRPFTGSLVMTMYDRAIEYISGGSNIPEIREHFWKWKRHHQPQAEHNLSRVSANLFKDHLQQMQFLGVFGSMSADVPQDMGMAMGGMEGAPGAPMVMMSKSAPGGGGGRGAARTRFGAPAPASTGFAENAMDEAGSGGANGQPGGPPMIEPTVRTNFADAAYWSVDLKPDSEGIATAKIKMPENLTAWKIRTWAMGPDTSVGEGTTEVTTAKNIMVRLQAPRFFVEKDELILSAVVHNYLDFSKRAEVSIDLGGNFLETADTLNQTVEIPAGGEKRVDWKVKVLKEGEVAITMAAKTDVESDAMQMKFPVLVHGMLKMDSYSGIVRNNEPGTKFEIRVPAERRPEQTRLEIRYSPSLAGTMVDALPYLNEFPYGCTEQTLNRFLPTIITLNTLKRMGLDLKRIQEKRTNLNAQEIGDDLERAKRWGDHNPVFDEAEVLRMAKQGVADLTKMQNRDGGWGWFSGTGEHSWPHTTATVVRGLNQAKQNGIEIVPGVLENGVAWLNRYQDEQIGLLVMGDRQKDLPADHPDMKKRSRSSADNLDALVYLALVESGVKDKQMADYLYRDRKNLSLYGMGLVGLACHLESDLQRRDMLINNINQFVKYDDENQSAFIDLPNQAYWWYWYGDSIEANAIFLKLMSLSKPNDKVTLGLVKYLINNRRHATYWKSTRDTALCVEAFADFIKASGEDKPEMTVEVVIDGTVVKTVDINKDNLFQFDNRFVIEGAELTDGKHTVELRRKGKGTVYANAYLTNFTKEDNIAAAGLEIKVQRAYYRLVQIKDAEAKVEGGRGQVVDQKIEKYKRIPLKNWDEVKSGDLVEIELEIDSKNDYEYVIFEDMKVSGCEPVDLVSGYRNEGLSAYVEFRDQRVAFFTRALPKGKHSFSYRMRAEIPGAFSALPTKAWAMYAPELKGNSDELKIKIADREDLK